MPDHRIQLRRAWEGPDGRIDLPNSWHEAAIPKQLRRNFHRPGSLPETDRLFLSFEDVPGLLAVRLNGVDLEFDAVTDSAWEVLVQSHIKASNQLVLDLETARVPRGRGWGRIALLIRS